MTDTRLEDYAAPAADPAYIESLYQSWLQDADSVDPSWQSFFRGYELARADSDTGSEVARDTSNIASLIYNYRDQGHRIADINPLLPPPDEIPDLQLASFGFGEDDLERSFDTGHLELGGRATLAEIVSALRETYCGSLAVEYLHIQDRSIRRWLQHRMEPRRNRPNLTADEKRRLLAQIMDAHRFEVFVQRHYIGQKRFSIEGGETLLPMLHALLESGPAHDVEEVVLGMAHRGRLNVLANVLGKSYSMIFSEFEDNYQENAVGGSGDVKYHRGYSSSYCTSRSSCVEVTLTANPSHLEAVDPVVLGRVRAKQRQRDDTRSRRKVVPVLIHGDAAFSGQGVVAETFNLARLDGYRVGGTVHIIVNNQIGFTTPPSQARSMNVTDLAKAFGAPVFHINGDDPEAAAYATELALEFRQTFGIDVVLHLLCMRRFGHSEVDDPELTQPRLYERIRSHQLVHDTYSRRLSEEGLLSEGDTVAMAEDFERTLAQALEEAQDETSQTDDAAFAELWYGLDGAYHDDGEPTGVALDTLRQLGNSLTEVPEHLRIHRKLQRVLDARRKSTEAGDGIDWATGEALAFASLLLDGLPVRLSGQDVERGTFAHRHAVWVDEETEETFTPFNQLADEQARFCVYNSPLSEMSILGFEYGYSLSEPRMLNLWEAQFGDFANGAQVIIDQFIVAAWAKWRRGSGLVMLLPHGYEGQGPEHSSAYLERYLQACAEDNIQVAVPSTPAQYFHVLRRQLARPFRRPLILMTPKSLLRHPSVRSSLDELAEPSRFFTVLDDPSKPKKPSRTVLCSGKLYYDLVEARDEAELEGVSLVRLEQLYPFPDDALAKVLKGRKKTSIVWAQEEPSNRGAWTYVAPRLEELLGRRPHYAGRVAAAASATGSLNRHREEQARLVAEALGIEDEEKRKSE